MKNIFYEHNIKTSKVHEGIINEGDIFIDTNSLLNIYRLSDKTRIKYLEILEKSKERLNITYHTGKEFYRNRPKVIYTKSNFKSSVKTEITNAIESIIQSIDTVKFEYKDPKNQSQCSLLKHEDELRKKIIEIISESNKNIEAVIDNHNISVNEEMLYGKDFILDNILKLFEGKVSKQISDTDLEKIYIDGKVRYEEKVPPGYMDKKDKSEPQRYGDLVIWNELMNYAKDNKKDVLFVSDDVKEDWCEKLKNEDIIIGPRTELIKEFHEKTGQNFYSITTTDFIKHISELYKIDNTEDLEKESDIIREDLEIKSKGKYNISDKILYYNKLNSGKKKPTQKFDRLDKDRCLDFSGYAKTIDDALLDASNYEIFKNQLLSVDQNPYLDFSGYAKTIDDALLDASNYEIFKNQLLSVDQNPYTTPNEVKITCDNNELIMDDQYGLIVKKGGNSKKRV